MLRSVIISFPVLACLALEACTSVPSPHTGLQVYRGTYRHGFEQSEFVAEGRTEAWWCAGDIGLVHTSAFLVVEGELSPPGHWGHLGAYERELRVRRVLKVERR